MRQNNLISLTALRLTIIVYCGSSIELILRIKLIEFYLFLELLIICSPLKKIQKNRNQQYNEGSIFCIFFIILVGRFPFLKIFQNLNINRHTFLIIFISLKAEQFLLIKSIGTQVLVQFSKIYIKVRKSSNQMQKRISKTSKDDLAVTQVQLKADQFANQSPSKIKQKEKQHANDERCCAYAVYDFIMDFIRLYALGQFKEKCLMAAGIFVGLISGVAFPITVYIWGKQIDHIVENFTDLKNSLDTSRNYFLALVGISIYGLLTNTLLFAIWKLISQTIARKFRQRYIQAFLKRRMAWIDSVNIYEEFNSFKENAFKIERAIGDKVALFFNLVGMLISGTVSALVIRWTFSLYLIAILPLGIVILGYFLYIIIMKKIETKEFYKESQSKSVEALAMIRTIKSLNAQSFHEKIYEQSLNKYIEKISVYPLKISISTGLFYFIQYFMFGIGLIFGIQCIKGTSACPVEATGSHYSIGQLHIVFCEICNCAFNLLQLAANYDAIKEAITSSKQIYAFCRQAEEEHQKIIKTENKSQQIGDFGEVQLKKVRFSYPSNPDKKILKGIQIKPLKNKFNAIVGVTGSGKSTVTQLLMKFYPPSEGEIIIGGRQIREIDEQLLRERVSIVGQEPVLFDGTIAENIRVGKRDATDEEIWEVLQKTNLEELVRQFPGELDYQIGFAGAKLSGGQKQRMAIARALIKKPQLLILDEATSALDRKSQKIVQKTLDKLFTAPDLNMTVICIAHKIRTILKADKIWYLQSGLVKYEGKFADMKCFEGVQLPPQQQVENDLFEDDDKYLTLRKTQNSLMEPKKSEKEIQQSKINIYSELLKYTDQKGAYIFAIVLSFINGLCHPFAILMLAYVYYNQLKLKILGSLSNWCTYSLSLLNQLCNSQMDSYFDDSVKLLGGLIGFAFFCFIPFFLQHYFMSRIQQEIQFNLKRITYKKLLRMPVEWYNQSENQGGQAASNYGLDVTQMSSLATTYIPILITNITTMVAGAIICLVYYWKVGLLTLYVIPLIAIGCYVTMIFISGYDDDTLLKYSTSNKTAMEIMTNIKTALCFNHHHLLLQKYKNLIFESDSSIMKNGAKIGLFYGLSIFLIILAIALMLYPAAHIVKNMDQSDQLNAVVSVVVPLWCGWVAGCSFFFVSGSAAGKQSAKRVFQLLQAKNESQVQTIRATKIIKPDISQIKGRIEFKNVSFRYKDTSRNVVKKLNFVIEAGQQAAFVGESGCGKSTLMLLLQRFYDFEGEITLDHVNIYNYDLQVYRSYFSTINQQPSLFTGNLKANIVANSVVSDAQIEHACKCSFVYDINRAWKGDISLQENIRLFIEKDAGHRGSKISGGEKQRVACARAMIKQPKIFLMDEGTSALDVQTEKKLLKNIQNGLKGVTTINIAHRMEAVEHCDVIFLIEEGKIVEHGRYTEMMQRKAHFFKFVQGSKYKTMDQIATAIMKRLVSKLLNVK